ncbi:bouquet formation protein Bqt3 [Schizosaccharomyces japonicus yFS275]|uniref:Bouquet formation protein Bqt3 n=1 Tax=Schizosaccharomyces japonicus (strain yFS275 / FY16936) TaxID=402676 RepID=B6K0D0_SCHJY|nr:bouquet formation protein Bqt3 [Schizosaccharomyces japonicus yFS275]EEB06280.1 bouquet formation protein Bqt3 [Schizosaccharomyces japonicus yFS275]
MTKNQVFGKMKCLRPFIFVVVSIVSHTLFGLYLNPRLLSSVNVSDKNVSSWFPFTSLFLYALQSCLFYRFRLGLEWCVLAKYPLYTLLGTYYSISKHQIAWDAAIDCFSVILARAMTGMVYFQRPRHVLSQGSVPLLLTLMASVLLSILSYVCQKLFVNLWVVRNIRHQVSTVLTAPLPLQYVIHLPIAFAVQRAASKPLSTFKALCLFVVLLFFSCSVPYCDIFWPNVLAALQLLTAYILHIVLVFIACRAVLI